MATHGFSVSEQGVALIKRFEGFRAEAARLPDGRYVVGHGHVRMAPPQAPFSPTQAEAALREDLAPIEVMLNHRVLAPINQAQFDALASLAFSIGADAFKRSDVLRRLNGGEPIAAACAIDAWRKSAAQGETQVIDVLVRRRAAEKALFLEAENLPPAPSAYLRPTIDHAQAVLSAAPIAPTPDMDAASAVGLPADSAMESRLLEILESEPATARLLTGEASAAQGLARLDDVLVLTDVVGETEDDAETTGRGGVDAPAAIEAAGDAKTGGFNGIDVSEVRAFVLLAMAGLTLIGMGAWALFNGGDAGQTSFLVLSAPGVVVTAMAGYHLARAQSARRNTQLPGAIGAV